MMIGERLATIAAGPIMNSIGAAYTVNARIASYVSDRMKARQLCVNASVRDEPLYSMNTESFRLKR